MKQEWNGNKSSSSQQQQQQASCGKHWSSLAPMLEEVSHGLTSWGVAIRLVGYNCDASLNEGDLVVFMLLPRKQAFFTALLLDQLAVCVLHIHSHQKMSSMERAVNTKKNHDTSSVKPLVWWDGKKNEKHATKSTTSVAGRSHGRPFLLSSLTDEHHVRGDRGSTWSNFFIVFVYGHSPDPTLRVACQRSGALSDRRVQRKNKEACGDVLTIQERKSRM